MNPGRCCPDGRCLLCRGDLGELAHRLALVLGFTLPCTWCGRSFDRRHNSRFCSVLCRLRSRRGVGDRGERVRP